MKSSYLCVAILAASSWFAAAQPQPVVLQEDFSSNPTASGWRTFGNASLFSWDAVNHDLSVTWDSSQTNSYYYHPLGTVLTTNSDFTLTFDLTVADAAISGYGFEIALGLLNFTNATSAGFLRGTGANSPNLIEFAFFPDPDGSLFWGPSVTAVMIDSSGSAYADWSSGGFAGIDLPSGLTFHLVMVYTGSDQTLRTTVFQGGAVFASVPDATLSAGFLGFQVDTLAIASYSGLDSGGSLLAHGTVGNILFSAAPPPIGLITQYPNPAGGWQVRFSSATNWLYRLERTLDFGQWKAVTSPQPGSGGDLFLVDTNPVPANAFYRVQAARP